MDNYGCFAAVVPAGRAMGLYYFTLTDGERAFGRREATEFAGLAEVQEEAIAFGRSVLKHRFLLGIRYFPVRSPHLE